jgi:hypothetical protein
VDILYYGASVCYVIDSWSELQKEKRKLIWMPRCLELVWTPEQMFGNPSRPFRNPLARGCEMLMRFECG